MRPFNPSFPSSPSSPSFPLSLFSPLPLFSFVPISLVPVFPLVSPSLFFVPPLFPSSFFPRPSLSSSHPRPPLFSLVPLFSIAHHSLPSPPHQSPVSSPRPSLFLSQTLTVHYKFTPSHPLFISYYVGSIMLRINTDTSATHVRHKKRWDLFLSELQCTISRAIEVLIIILIACFFLFYLH